MLRVCVIGAGSWGTALALLLHRNGNRVHLWARRSSHVSTMRETRRNEHYLPGQLLPTAIGITDKIDQALEGAELVVVSVPSHAFSVAVEMLGGVKAPIVLATKGFELETGRLLHEVAVDKLGKGISIGVLSGPSFANEVAQNLPGAVTLAANKIAEAKRLAAIFRSDYFRVYISNDLVGVQIGGGVKNVLALATGISDGLGFGANTRAALITRGLAELSRLGAAVGARHETLIGLSGLGDLVLTCTDDRSRNRRAGLILGKGGDIELAKRDIGQVVEGVTAVKEVIRMARKYGVEMPICEQVEQVVSHGQSPAKAVEVLLNRAVGLE